MGEGVEIKIIETRVGGPESGIVEGPTLRGMKPHPGTTDEFIYSFDIRYKGNPAKATTAAWKRVPDMLDQLPEGLADGVTGGYKKLLGDLADCAKAAKALKEREDEVAKENRRLMEAVDAQEKLNKALQDKIDDAEAERGRLESIKKDWRLRIDALVAQKVESRRCDAVIEAVRLRRDLAKAKGELKALKSAMSIVGRAFGGEL